MVNMSEVQKVKIPVYVAEFLNKYRDKGFGLVEILSKLIEIHEYFYGCTPDNQKEHCNVMIASWVEKFKDENITYDSLVMIVSDIYRNGYDIEYLDKKFVIYDKNEDKFVDVNFDLTILERAMSFKTKESAKKFIMNNYEIQEIYEDED